VANDLARFYNLHHTDLRKYVKAIIEVKPTINAGFDFAPVDGDGWLERPHPLPAEWPEATTVTV
jgi:hypothetical protein